MNIFNQIYEENRVENVHDEGYEQWIKENQATNEDIEHNSSLTKDNFNTEFAKNKQQYMRKTGNQMTKYSEPKEDISYKNKDSIMALGGGKIDDFSGESGGLAFRDYKDAYTNTFLIGDEVIDPKRPTSFKSVEKERAGVSYEMDEKDIELYTLKKMKEEKEEKIRMNRLVQHDQKSFDIYDRVHQRMLGN
jgi:hypothetical protein